MLPRKKIVSHKFCQVTSSKIDGARDQLMYSTALWEKKRANVQTGLLLSSVIGFGSFWLILPPTYFDTHHQRFHQDVFDELEVITLELFALGTGSFRLFIGIKAEELRFVFELTLLQNWGWNTKYND